MNLFYGFGFIWAFFVILMAVKIGSGFLRSFFRNGSERTEYRGNRSLRRSSAFDELYGPQNRYNQMNDLEHKIYRLADRLKGRITISDVVIHTGLGSRESEEMLNSWIDGIRIRMEVQDNGIVVYEFPEIIARYEHE